MASVAHADGVQANADGVQAKVDALLAGSEFVPTASDWNRVGPEAAAALMKRASEPNRDLLDRARSVSALAHFATKDVRTWLRALQADAAAPSVLRRKAQAALTHAFPAPANQPDEFGSPKPAVAP